MSKTFTIFGLGTFGWQTARALYRRGADVLAVDRNPDLVERIKDEVTRAVCAEVTDAEALTAVGAYEVDAAVVALRRHFDTSVLVTHMLRKKEVDQILVQVDSAQEAEAVRVLGATHVIFAERDMAETIARQAMQPGLSDEIPLGDDVGIVEAPCPEEFTGKSLADLSVRRRFGVDVVAIKTVADEKGPNGETVVEAAPSPDAPLPANAVLVVLGKTKDLEKFVEKCRNGG